MATQDGSIDVPDSSENASEGDIDVEKANVETLHRNAIGIVGLVAGAAGAVAPLAAMFFNVPLIVDQAGAAAPLVFLISAVGMIFSLSFRYSGSLSGWSTHKF